GRALPGRRAAPARPGATAMRRGPRQGGAEPMTARRPVADAVAARRRADLVSGLRGLARPRASVPAPVRSSAPPPGAAATEACDLCGVGLPEDHRHLLHLGERRIVCACEACWAMRSGE